MTKAWRPLEPGEDAPSNSRVKIIDGIWHVRPATQVERAVDDGQSDDSPSTDDDPNVADSDAESFKEKLKSINFGRVPGGAR